VQLKAFSLVNVVVILALTLGLAGTFTAPVYAQPESNPAPVQTYYVTLPENDALTVLKAINSAAVSPISTYFSIAVATDNTLVYYDQWENGYDSDIANPTNLYSTSNLGGTQIWGNGLAADGCAPNKSGAPVACSDANDVLNAGDVIVPHSVIPVPRDSNNIFFDARDKVGASASIAMARATWAAGSNTLNAFAHEMYSTNEWGTAYEAPVGTNTSNAGSMFEYSGLTIMASQNNTTVQVDADANGSFETTVTLNEGQATLVAPTRQGARVQSDKPVQVTLVTGDIGSAYASRDMSLLPVSAFGSSAWSPVGVDSSSSGPTRLFLYNPSDSNSIHITCEVRGFDNFRDQFSSTNWNNSDGSIDWTGSSWIRENDSGNKIFITSGGVLRFDTGAVAAASIKRVANLSGRSIATLSFTLDRSGGGGGSSGDLKVQISSDGGSNWTDLETFTSNPDGATQRYDISAYIASNTTVRFITVGALTGSRQWNIDNVDIRVDGPLVSTTQPAGPNSVATVDLADYQAARCFASDANGAPTSDKIFGIATVDTAGLTWDWSFTMYPDEFLTTDALVGLGLGRDPTSNTNPNENGNPVWVTPACTIGSTFVYVDWDNNGTPDLVDLNGDGDTNDIVDGISESTTNNGISVNRLQSVRLFRPSPANLPYAQTGARIWSRTASGVGSGGTPGCSLALAWGQDPHVATGGAPGLDVGTSVPPLRLVESSKSLSLKTDADGDGLLSPGDTATYLITVHNAGPTLVSGVHVYDTVPANTTYVANSTEKNLGPGWTAIPDGVAPNTFPLEPAPGVALGNLDPVGTQGGVDTFYVRFDVVLGVGDYDQINNCSLASTAAGNLERCAISRVATMDWGDLPDSYGTTAAANGPRHSPSNLRLGAWFDRELQGQPSSGANGDDVAETTLPHDNDEDGVLFLQGSYGANEIGLKVTVTDTANANTPACLNAWMDFTDGTTLGEDGDFNDVYQSYPEYVIQNSKLLPGEHFPVISLPTGLLSDQPASFYFRFRLSPTDANGNCSATIAPTGFVSGGEVEDYRFSFEPTSGPLAVTLAGFEAQGQGDRIVVSWETVSELDNAGFNLYRTGSFAEQPGQDDLLTYVPSQAPGSTQGAAYRYEDLAVQPGESWVYWLEDVSLSGVTTLHGPVSAAASAPTAVTLSGLQAGPVASAAPAALPLAGALLALLAAAALRRRA
jgi:uncharacterized repeat protein (TIGR01451 family)